MEDSSTTETTTLPSLPKLLSALAVGAKSVNSLPISKNRTDPTSRDSDDDDDDIEDDEDDEFNYLMAFPEFNHLCLEARNQLTSLLHVAIRSSCSKELSDGQLYQYILDEDPHTKIDFEDPLLWKTACYLLLEHVDVYIQNVKEGRIALDPAVASTEVAKNSSMLMVALKRNSSGI